LHHDITEKEEINMKKAMNTVLGIFGVVALFYLLVLVTAWI